MRAIKLAVLVLAVGAIVAGPALADPSPPVNQSPPVLSPSRSTVGSTVTVTPGTWSGEDSTSTLSYQWYSLHGPLDGAFTLPIMGATGQSYTVTTADEGGLAVLVTVTADSGAVSASEYSNSIAIQPLTPPLPVSPPVLSGKGVRGSTLHVSTGTWAQYPSPIAGTLSYSYQWLRCQPHCDVVIPGATKATYAIRPLDWGWGLAVKVTATDLIGPSYVYSNAVPVTPPTMTKDEAPFPRWSAEDPLLITEPAGGQCFGTACTEEPVSVLLQRNGYTRVLTVKQAAKLSVQWVATKGARHVTLGSERAVFHKAGKYRTRFVLSRKGRALLRSSHRLSFDVVGWLANGRGDSSGCAYSGKVNAARQILIEPDCFVPAPFEQGPF